jgi:hypothetical protein
MRNVVKGLVLSAAVIAVIGGTISASAVPPTKDDHVDEGWFTLVFTDENDVTVPGCEGFSEEMVSERATELTYYDRAGVAVKGVLHGKFLGTITNSVTGQTFRDHSTFTETYDLVEGTTTVSGSSYHYIVKGQGQVFAEVGHKITIDETGEISFQAGQDDFVQSDVAGICEALS